MFFDEGKYAKFVPVKAQADSDKLAEEYERLLIYFPKRWEPGQDVQTKLAPRGMIHAGWVVGVRYVGKPGSDSWYEEEAMSQDHSAKRRAGTLTVGNTCGNIGVIGNED